MNRASVIVWHKRFKEGRESVREDERRGRSKEVRIPELIGQGIGVRGYNVDVLREFRKRFDRKRPALFKSDQWQFPPGEYTSSKLHPCHRLFEQDGHQDISSASL